MIKDVLILCLLCLLSNLSIGQSIDMRYNDECVKYINSTVHGLGIIAYNLEIINWELNKALKDDEIIIDEATVALLEAFRGDDFLSNDTYYQIWDSKPPKIRIVELKTHNTSNPLQIGIKEEIQKLHGTASSLIELLFELHTDIIDTKNIDRKLASEIYSKLETAKVDLDLCYDTIIELDKMLRKTHIGYKKTKSERIMELFTLNLGLLSKNVRNNSLDYITQLGILENMNNDVKINVYKNYIHIENEKSTERTDDILINARKLLSSDDLPSKWRRYGKFYYHHNKTVNGTMQSGNRNDIIVTYNYWKRNNTKNYLTYVCYPPLFKVIYPKSLMKKKLINSTIKKITSTPKTMLNRNVRIADQVIEVDSLVFELGIYDSKIKDGDVISFNFNQDWLLVEEKLSDKPVNLHIQLNENGKNFFILHSDDVGRNPPTTIGLRYRYGGKLKTVKLSSDLHESEMIEIKYVPSKN